MSWFFRMEGFPRARLRLASGLPGHPSDPRTGNPMAVYIQSPMMKSTSFIGLVLKRLIGVHRTSQI